jgi:hypothetical protein
VVPGTPAGQHEHDRSEHRTIVHLRRPTTLRPRSNPGINGCANATTHQAPTAATNHQPQERSDDQHPHNGSAAASAYSPSIRLDDDVRGDEMTQHLNDIFGAERGDRLFAALAVQHETRPTERIEVGIVTAPRVCRISRAADDLRLLALERGAPPPNPQAEDAVSQAHMICIVIGRVGRRRGWGCIGPILVQ